MQFSNAFAQAPLLTGKVSNEQGEPVPHIYIYLKDSPYHTETDMDGKYQLSAAPGDYVLACYGLGYERIEKTISLIKGKKLTVNFTLNPDSKTQMQAVEVSGKSITREINESAYNAIAIDAKLLQNTTMDLSQAIEKSSGVRIRRSGGMGSNTSVTLNGFTGNHVKIFMDGIPMSGFGPAFNINNIPINMAERIEVYKGVVPIELGSDALGGAINIVTRKTSNTYLDASYSYGSFNTHKTSVNFGTTTRSGLTFSINAFQNYSDNNYKVKTKLLDLETNIYSQEEQWFERFHDTYHNETIVAKLGVVNKSWADRLVFGGTLANMETDIQNANIMQIAFGEKARKAKTSMASMEYIKHDFIAKDLDLTLSGNYSVVRNTNIDTSAFRYNWAGDRRNMGKKGEGDYSLGKFNNNTGLLNANIRYTPGERHFISLNNVLSSYSRKNTDEKATEQTLSAADSIKRTNIKNVTGLSYSYKLDEKWSLSAFGKNYFVKTSGSRDTSSTTTQKFALKSSTFNTSGYGIAGNYRLNPGLLFKLSLEKTFRLPSATELFGDEILEAGTIDLKAENSDNINVNVIYSPEFGPRKQHSIYSNLGMIYRYTKDYIRRQVEQRYGGAFYTNHGEVRTLGVDLETRYQYLDKFSLGISGSYQRIVNMEPLSSRGTPSIIYKDPMPNQPILFGNIDASYRFLDLGGQGNILTVSYFLNYVDKFYREWKSEGSTSDKITIPKQLSHDVSLTYVLQNGKYNVSLEAQNITDAMLYDNYSLQKPGRSFSVKLRYFFTKFN
ncbi:ligand-gated channel protein [Echinicola rosea]|uniref:Ligand-gated channel protein n=2 Tax=Echinicola rosea TaxID=1807691 RepID=A0ABQ1VBJ8_9BACT|nr:ligand-gated channel protein [Echinicola rosea]